MYFPCYEQQGREASIAFMDSLKNAEDIIEDVKQALEKITC